jgi:preprotein translocase subunit SecE
MTADEAAKTVQHERRRRRRRRSRLEEAEKPALAPGQTARKEHPTPSRRDDEKKPNLVMRMVRPVIDYLRDTRSELAKVTWPTREEALRLSGIVLVVTIVSSIALGTVDLLYGELFRLGFSTPVIFLIFAVVQVVGVVVTTTLLRRRGSGY